MCARKAIFRARHHWQNSRILSTPKEATNAAPFMATTALISVAFATPAHANLAVSTLGVDPELHPERVAKAITAEGATVCARFEAADARALRVAMGAYMDMVGVVLRTLREFGEGC